MDMKRLRYFCTIVEQGQISRAARILHMSQPPLSQRLKELEEELGVPLIIRDDGQWTVTEAGKMLYEQAGSLLSGLDDLKRQVVDTGNAVGGLVSVGVSTTCETSLLRVLPRLHRQYPAMRFRIAVMDSSFLENSIQDKTLDIAILLLPLEAGDEYHVFPLPPEGFCVVYNPELPFPDKDDVGLDDLLDIPLLLSRRWNGGGSYDFMMQHWQKNKKTPQIIADSHNIHTLLRLVEMGMPAATIVPAGELTGEMRSGLCVRPLVHEGLSLYPVLITKKGRFANRAARCLIDAVTGNAPA